jgi:DNA-binding response OmpR family regulator
MSSHRILYVGHNLALLAHLRAESLDYQVVRCPVGSQARILITGINYSLLLLDEELPDATGSELARFSCSLARTVCTPFIIIKKPCDLESLARAVMEVFAA